MKRVCLIIGARPNFVKAASLYKAFQEYPEIKLTIVHTGQHYTEVLSDDIINQIGLKVDVNLNVYSSLYSDLITAIDKYLSKNEFDMMIILGDVNSSFAGAYVAKNRGIPLAHVESGLRSGLWYMPEELNRFLIDALSDYLFFTNVSAMGNVSDEFVDKKKFLVGNIMIDTLVAMESYIKESEYNGEDYAIATFHRKENISTKESILEILDLLKSIKKIIPVKFYVHPHFTVNMSRFLTSTELEYYRDGNLMESMYSPISYLDFIKELHHSKFVITDSGGVQEESCIMNKPCLVYRKNTDRPITILLSGTVVTQNFEKIIEFAKKQNNIPINKSWDSKAKNHMWGDGQAGKRIAKIINDILKEGK